MSESDDYRRKADRLLSRAAGAANMAERGRLIDEALHWHNIAMGLSDHAEDRLNDNQDDDPGDAAEDEQAASGG